MIELPLFQTGVLTRKGFYVCLATCEVPTLRKFGEEHMEYGPGAVDGSNVFLGGCLPMPGDDVTKDLRKYVAKHSLSGCNDVLVADIEVSLCTIIHYCKHIAELKKGKGAMELTVFPGYRPYVGDKHEAEPVIPWTAVAKRPATQLPSGWYTRVLKKRPATKDKSANVAQRRPTPAFLATDAKPQQRAKRGSPGARPSTAKGVRKFDDKHPNYCTVCKRWFGARAKMHCWSLLQLNAGDIIRRR